MKKYVLKNLKISAYYRSRLGKGIFHYSFTKGQATVLTKQKATSLLNEVKNKDNFKIMEISYE